MIENAEFVRKERRFKALSPDLRVDFCAKAFGDFVGREAAVGENDVLECGRVAVGSNDRLEGFGKARKPLGTDRKARGHCVTAEAQHDVRELLGDKVEHVAQVNPGYRAPRALEFARLCSSKGDHRAMYVLFDAGGDKTDDAFVETLVKERYRGERFGR